MKKITLKKLTLQDWRGQNKVIDFSSITEIRGRNKSGKSTIFNAFLWLLMGVDEEDNSNYKLFDERIEPTKDNSKVASVEGVILVDGIEYVFKRTAEMGWTRRRGSDVYERKGTDNYHFYIDSIERNATDYKAFVEELIAPYAKMKLMLNIRYYLGMDWKDLRKMFESLVGVIKLTDFQGDYTSIQTELSKYTPEQIKESIRGQIKPIKANIDSLPITIQTLQSSLPDISGIDGIQGEIDAIKKNIADIDAQISGNSDTIKPFIDKRNAELLEIDRLKKEYEESKSAYDLTAIQEANKIKAEIYEIDAFNQSVDKANEKAEKEFEQKKKDLTLLSKVVSDCEKRHKELTEKNNEVKARQFTADTCAYCGQPLQGDKLEEAKKRFFEQKEKDHQYIVSQGKQNREYWDRSLPIVENLQKEIAEGIKIQSHKSKANLENKLAVLRANFVPYDKTIEGSKKVSEIENLKANLTSIPQQDNEYLIKTKNELLNEIEEKSKRLGMKDTYDSQVLKINQCQQDLKANAIELATLEGKLHTLENYEREKASIISNRVNSNFNYLHVEMQEINKSGAIVDTCKVTDKDGVSASVTNTASKMLIGIDLSMAIQKIFDVELPIFVDDADLMNEDNFPTIPNQTIKLIVDDNNGLNVVNYGN